MENDLDRSKRGRGRKESMPHCTSPGERGGGLGLEWWQYSWSENLREVLDSECYNLVKKCVKGKEKGEIENNFLITCINDEPLIELGKL